MRQNIEFEESDLTQIKEFLRKENRGKAYKGQITNQSAIDEAIRIANISLDLLCPYDLVMLGITKKQNYAQVRNTINQ